MSEDKIEIYVEIGPNLKSVIQDSIAKMDLYNEPVAAESMISTLFGSIRTMIVDILKTKKKETTESTGPM